VENLIRIIKRFIWPQYQMSEKESLLYDIIRKLLQDDNTECITAPLTGTYYISNHKYQYWIKVWDEGCTLTNHKFSYSQHGNIKYQRIIIDIIQQFMEKDRAEFESQVFTNEVELLKQIKENVSYI
jgi:hypothetical protein